MCVCVCCYLIVICLVCFYKYPDGLQTKKKPTSILTCYDLIIITVSRDDDDMCVCVYV